MDAFLNPSRDHTVTYINVVLTALLIAFGIKMLFFRGDIVSKVTMDDVSSQSTVTQQNNTGETP